MTKMKTIVIGAKIEVMISDYESGKYKSFTLYFDALDDNIDSVAEQIRKKLNKAFK